MKRKNKNKKKFSLFGEDIFGSPVEQLGGIMQRRYIWPPFSVLNAKDGTWLNRKRAWLALGIKSEIGREEMTIPKDKTKALLIKGTSNAISKGISPDIKTKFESAGTGVSIFDPVLCELMYTWFCPPGGQVVDPFAGGSVRGVVASLLGFRYWGCDLNNRQIQANVKQAKKICNDNQSKPEWVYGDSLEKLPRAPEADMIFSCPPYVNLEVYTDDPRDLSTMKYPEFLTSYEKIVQECFKKLNENRFACFVVGEVRDKKGHYYGFVADTIKIFQKCGFHFYNDVILDTPSGSLSVRAGRAFNATRKLGKAHQNVLIFIKGDARAATNSLKKDCE